MRKSHITSKRSNRLLPIGTVGTSRLDIPRHFPNPSDYAPSTPGDLIGKARLIAAVLFARIERMLATAPENLRLLFVGPPGCGKSLLASLIARRISGHVSDIEEISGKRVGVDVVSRWIDTVHLSNLWGGHSVKVIEEVDRCTPDAMALMLNYLDHVKRVQRVAVIASSNGTIDQFDKRFQSRWQPWVFEPPGYDEIAGFLVDRFGAEADKAEEIAFGCGGDVRAACNDLQSAFDVERAGREIACLAA